MGEAVLGHRGTNLIRRKGTYYFRSRVPAIHQASIGKKEIILSLRTCDYDEARLLTTELRFQILACFEEIKMADNDNQGTPEGKRMASLMREAYKKTKHPRLGELPTISMRVQSETNPNESEIYNPVEDIKNLSASVESAKNDANDAQKALVKATLAGNAPIAPQASPPTPDLHPDADNPFHTFTEDYIANRGEGDKQEHRTAFKQMRKVLGVKPIKDITKNDIISVIESMKAKKGKKGNATVSYKTIDKKLSCMRGFFQKMMGDRNLIATNPVDGITSGASKHEKEEAEDNKRPFNKAELRKIFHSPLFTGCSSLTRVYDKGDVLCRNEKFWLPILGFYSGARIAELWQLEITDVVKKDGGWFIYISRESKFGQNKRTKNIPSIRYVPIHPDLIKIGFWDYLENRKKKANKDGRLFPKYGYGRMFNQTLLREKLKIDDYDVSFHCLRHCFKDACVEADIPDSLISRLMGHGASNITEKYGAKDLFKKQTEMMNRIKFLIPMNHLFK